MKCLGLAFENMSAVIALLTRYISEARLKFLDMILMLLTKFSSFFFESDKRLRN